METLRSRLPRRLVAGVCGVLMTATACSAADKKNASAADCRPVRIEEWQPFPTEFVNQSMATVLGASEAEISQGRFGEAVCRRGVTMGEIETEYPIVSVEGIASRCLVIGVADKEEPKPDKKYDHLAVACAPLKPSS